jgi:phage tail sheath gpL-like
MTNITQASTVNWTSIPSGSLYSASFVLTNADGSLYALSTQTFEYVVRIDPSDSSATPLIKLTTTSSAAGILTVNTGTSTVTITLNPAATATLPTRNLYAQALWMNPATATAVPWFSGQFIIVPLAQP